MSDGVLVVLFVLSVPMLLVGVAELAYYPLAITFALRRRRGGVFDEPVPLVSIVVPAYNEGRVVTNCVESVLAAPYPRKEVILVDDGSTDDTLAILERYSDRATVISRPNGGKAAALNTGIAHARGEILFFVDADGVFTDATIPEMLAAFTSPDVGAVCGNDEPVNLDRVQTRLLALLTHGTAFVRRALALIGCLTIVSGNCGAFRRSTLAETGGFTEGFIGEDLELTWRVHRAGYRVAFAPRAVVYAEVPSTVGALWRQRVRWTRGHAQTVRLHRDMIGSPRFGVVGAYLPVNVATMLVFPLLQLVVLPLLVVLALSGASPVAPTVLGVVGWLGLVGAVATTLVAVALDRAWRDLRYLYVIPLWPVFSVLMSLVVANALWLELRGAPSRWNKLARTGVVSRGDVSRGKHRRARLSHSLELSS